jgi:hypothetical protein
MGWQPPEPRLQRLLNSIRGGVMGQSEYRVLNVPRCFAYRSASFVLSSGVIAALPMDTKVWDTDSMFDLSNPTAITIRTPGVYDIDVWCLWPASAASYREAWIKVTGTGTPTAGALGGQHTSVIAPNAVPTVTGQEIHRKVQLNKGDFFQLMINQSTGGNLTLPASGGSSIYEHGMQATLVSTL